MEIRTENLWLFFPSPPELACSRRRNPPVLGDSNTSRLMNCFLRILKAVTAIVANQNSLYHFRHVVLLFLIAITILPSRAWAYIDPGTGSFVIQGIIAVIIGGGLAFKMFWKKIFGKSGDQDYDDDD